MVELRAAASGARIGTVNTAVSVGYVGFLHWNEKQ
jgi:hypothetical protein